MKRLDFTKKVFGLTIIFCFILVGVVFAAGSATYNGSFVSSVTSNKSIDITNGSMSISHTQSSTLGRNVRIEALKKGILGYSKEKTAGNVGSNVSNKRISVSGLSKGKYKIKFVETSGNCPGCKEIKVKGSFSN